jgi:hypothetical protein
MSDLRKAAEMALVALKQAAECVQLNYQPDKIGHDWDEQIEALRQALAQPEPIYYVPGFYCEEKISLSRIKLGERFVLVRTGQIYFKTKDGYWNESEQRPARLHLNCQVQLIKEKNT